MIIMLQMAPNDMLKPDDIVNWSQVLQLQISLVGYVLCMPRGIYSAMISYCLPRPILSDVISFRTCINSLRFEVDIQYIHKPTSILPSGNLI